MRNLLIGLALGIVGLILLDELLALRRQACRNRTFVVRR
jgi:hypothetical protein